MLSRHHFSPSIRNQVLINLFSLRAATSDRLHWARSEIFPHRISPRLNFIWLSNPTKDLLLPIDQFRSKPEIPFIVVKIRSLLVVGKQIWYSLTSWGLSTWMMWSLPLSVFCLIAGRMKKRLKQIRKKKLTPNFHPETKVVYKCQKLQASGLEEKQTFLDLEFGKNIWWNFFSFSGESWDSPFTWLWLLILRQLKFGPARASVWAWPDKPICWEKRHYNWSYIRKGEEESWEFTVWQLI